MPALVLAGRPGSGKGTLGASLASTLNIPHISTGDIFRKHMEDRTSLGVQIIEALSAGEYAPDDVTNEIIMERLSEPDCRNGYILDGYPRTVEQVIFMEENNVQVDAAVYLEVDEKTCLTRILSRGEKSGRADDQNESTVQRRLDIYTNTMTPVLDRYSSQGKLATFDGAESPEKVLAAVITAVS